MLSARARSAVSGKIDGSTAIDSGIISAAPMPRMLRAMINAAALPEYAHHTEDAPKSSSANISSRL